MFKLFVGQHYINKSTFMQGSWSVMWTRTIALQMCLVEMSLGR